MSLGRILPLPRAQVVRPWEDRWLVSASVRVLDGEVRSDTLRKLFGWHEPPDLFVLAAQLGQISQTSETREETEESQEANLFAQAMALTVPTLYKAMERLVEAAARSTVDDTSVLLELRDRPCVWVGRRFVPPALTALHSPISLSPYLHVVPADLHCFGSVLRKLGVQVRALPVDSDGSCPNLATFPERVGAV